MKYKYCLVETANMFIVYMSLSSKVLFSTEKPIFDVNDIWLPHGNYSFQIKHYTDSNTIQGEITSQRTNGNYEFKYFTVIKMMAKAQSRMARRCDIGFDVTQYPSPSNSPETFPIVAPSPRSLHNISPINYSTCAICLEKCNNRTDCGHFFHKKCISDWEQISGTCPVCRENTGVKPSDDK
jgi:hypothetical protein